MTESHEPRRSWRRCSRSASVLLVLFFFDFFFIFEESLVDVLLLVLFVFFVVVVVEIVVIRDAELVRSCHHQRFAAFGTAQLVTLLVFGGVDLVEFTFGADSHRGISSLQQRSNYRPISGPPATRALRVHHGTNASGCRFRYM